MRKIITLAVALVLVAAVVPVAFDLVFTEEGTAVSSTVSGVDIKTVGLLSVDTLYVPEGSTVTANISGTVALTNTSEASYNYTVLHNDVSVYDSGAKTADDTFDVTIPLVAGEVNTVKVNTTVATEVTTLTYGHTVEGSVEWATAVKTLWQLIPIIVGIILLLIFGGKYLYGRE